MTKKEILSGWGIVSAAGGYETPPTIESFPRKGWWPSARMALDITVTYWMEDRREEVLAAYDAAF